MGAGAPLGDKKMGAEFMGLSCKCTPEGGEGRGGKESHFYWAEEEGAAFNFGEGISGN